MEDNYQTGDRCRFSEERCQYDVEVVRNLCNSDQIGYELRVLKVHSPPARFPPHDIGALFTISEPRNALGCLPVMCPTLDKLIADDPTPTIE